MSQAGFLVELLDSLSHAAAQDDPGLALEPIAQPFRNLLSFEHASLALPLEGSSEWRVHHAPASVRARAFELIPGDAALPRRPLEGRPLVVGRPDDLADCATSRAWLSALGCSSALALALTVGERRLGVLAFFARREDGFADADLDALGPGAALAALAVAHVDNRRRLRRDREALDRERETLSAERRQLDEARRAPRPRRERVEPSPSAADLRPLATLEREAIERVLVHTGGRVSGPLGAARILGLKPSTLDSRMKKLGVRRPRR